MVKRSAYELYAHFWMAQMFEKIPFSEKHLKHLEGNLPR